jgi:DnaJ-domain-containing protein 1
MNNISNYLWIILLVIYIISPFDAHPLVLDDLIASGFLFYMLYKNSRQKKQQQQYYQHSGQSQSSHQTPDNESTGPLTLKKAYRLLGVDSNTPLDEIAKAYRNKMTQSHPDKVTHLSEELQAKAKELTLQLNEAYDFIKKYKKG